MNTWRVARPGIVAVLLVVLLGVPLWLVFITSAKSQGDALSPSLALPHDGWHLAEVGNAIDNGEKEIVDVVGIVGRS